MTENKNNHYPPIEFCNEYCIFKAIYSLNYLENLKISKINDKKALSNLEIKLSNTRKERCDFCLAVKYIDSTK